MRRQLAVSFWVTPLLTEQWKPFTDTEFNLLIAAAEETCPEKANLFKSVSLLARTITPNVEVFGSNISSQLKNKANDFVWFSLALDESTDATGAVQLSIDGLAAMCEVTEELASVNSLLKTTAENMFPKS